ncbi:ACP phosphodiesterase [Budvicia diplopodorum]|uniref:acyl carrier protein phosphodiesterase n=1 Tax=Budvicia diplopodorum TaxID=1119056 RepID=UPI00135CF452|nr:ACP phosphodiesterase [Budvicia diplopodorum]
MNFLAHLHLASLAESSLLGNVLADFVRGNPEANYSGDIVSGIRLHRRIDKLTDSLEPVKQARSLFSVQNYRVAPIALDVLWDHFLSRHWAKMEPKIALTDFIQCAQDSITPSLPSTPEDFQHMNQYLWRERWLERYAELPFIDNTLKRMAARRPKLSALGECILDIQQNYTDLEAIFFQFYPEMANLAKTKNL